ncbi:MAG TPA: sigma-54 dependent transcriptional regulator [Pirellulaceae bacterium]|nr:sigma-54 dependent transcriptional regulator [Pirellulaceae bacterium]
MSHARFPPVDSLPHGSFASERRRRPAAMLPGASVDQIGSPLLPLAPRSDGRVALIGESPAIRAIRTTLERLAASRLPILILGEPGTGKEIAARSVHQWSERNEGPFVAVNCGAIPATLLESELFGHERGAFTGANEPRPGRFETAHAGTLLLDEIGELSQAGQAALLRVLEEGLVTRVGGRAARPIDVRIVAATNRNPTERIASGDFRADLYYRLAGAAVVMPPLRERKEDLPLLTEHLLARFAARERLPLRRPSPEAAARLVEHDWPGNVRELAGVLQQACCLASGDRIEVADLRFLPAVERIDESAARRVTAGANALGGARVGNRDESHDVESCESLAEATRRFQRDHVRRAIAAERGNLTRAAGRLGLTRANLYRKLAGLGIDPRNIGARTLNEG